MKVNFGVLVLVGLPVLFEAYGCTKSQPTATSSNSTEAPHEDPNGYYTCSMHPQIHQHEPGKCPICGMDLIKVKGKTQESKQSGDSAPGIQVSDSQLSLAGIGKYTVTRKDLIFSVPVSGRMISSREVAFQVFESDLAIVKPGARFSGASAYSPGEILRGEIRFIDNLVDPSSRTVRTTGSLYQAPRKTILEGAFHGEIEVTEKAQIAVPEEAVLHTGKGALVYVISSENTLRPRQIVLGKKTRDEYQIISGLREGDMISTGPNFLIDSESKLRVASAPQGEGKSSPDKPSLSSCPKGQRWDVPMNMCMPGEG